MVGIDAGGVSAEVIDYQSIRDRAFVQNMRYSMSHACLARHAEVSVPIGSCVADP